MVRLQKSKVKIMENVKIYQGNGYDYKIFYAEDGQLLGMMYMTSYQISQFLWYKDLVALDWKLNRRTLMGGYSTVQLVQTTTKIGSFCTFLLGFAKFLLKSMREISESNQEAMKLIAMETTTKIGSFCTFLHDS